MSKEGHFPQNALPLVKHEASQILGISDFDDFSQRLLLCLSLNKHNFQVFPSF